jgi:hypothetical protein
VGAKSLAAQSAKESKMTGKPGKTCTICASPDLVAIQKLITENVPLLDIVARFPAVKKSALSRHSINHMGRKGTGGHASRGSGIGSPKGPAAKSLPDGRCPTCLQLVGESSEALTNEQILKRAERNLHISESVAINAQESNDARLALLAVDRTQRSIEMFCKIAGLLGPDTVVNVDARQQNAFVGWPTESLRFLTELAGLLESGMPVQEALASLQSAKESTLALPGCNREPEAA